MASITGRVCAVAQSLENAPGSAVAACAGPQRTTASAAMAHREPLLVMRVDDTSSRRQVPEPVRAESPSGIQIAQGMTHVSKTHTIDTPREIDELAIAVQQKLHSRHRGHADLALLEFSTARGEDRGRGAILDSSVTRWLW
jgi:hypothetical protein